ncbi:hypothetical protein D3C85_1270340 [compost metagenome]
MQSTARTIEHYILAKDGNRPDLLRQCFAAHATLEMVVRTGAISFPPTVDGRAGIADILARRFGQTYENVYTFCLGAPPTTGATTHRCKWLVGMSVKATGELRVGCGDYLWRFLPESGLAEHLSITIEHMQACPAQDLEPVMDWLQRLNYPWCLPGDMMAAAPPLGALDQVIEYLER